MSQTPSELTQEVHDIEHSERKKKGAKCGHVKRCLKQETPLTGKVLEYALDVLGGQNFADPNDPVSTADKLVFGQKLSPYELHIMIDVLLLHRRLS